MEHGQAVKWIGRYLLGTRTKGIQVDIQQQHSPALDIHVDADFAGNWNKDNAESPASVISHTGFVIRYFGCPVLWESKLQTEIALSPTEAEYIAL